MAARVPPHNLDAEVAVLGGLMLDPASWDMVSDIIYPESFYKSAHQKIFAAIQDLQRRNQPIDFLTVSNHLAARGEMGEIGGNDVLYEILNQTPSAANIKSYAEIVAEKYLLRRVISTASEITQEAYDADFEDLSGFLGSIESRIYKLAEKRKTEGLVSSTEIVRQSLERIEELYGLKTAITGVPSGFSDLDRMTSGFNSGELIIIAARPSMGKTAFCLNIAANAAVKSKKRVAFFSLEMGREQLMIRLLATESQLNISDIRTGRIQDAAWPRLIHGASTLAESPLFIDDTSGISPFEILTKCRRLKSQGGLDMIMIDYLQMMQLKQRVESREREVSEISKTLKGIAKELKVPVVALAQLNRGVEGRSDRRPQLSDLRESGSIEQDADLIMMIYREDYYEKENPEERGVAEILINKQRNGPTGKVKLSFNAHFGQFRDLAPDGMVPPPPRPESRSGSPQGRGELRALPNLAPRKDS